jgi:hypothetical protein
MEVLRTTRVIILRGSLLQPTALIKVRRLTDVLAKSQFSTTQRLVIDELQQSLYHVLNIS